MHTFLLSIVFPRQALCAYSSLSLSDPSIRIRYSALLPVIRQKIHLPATLKSETGEVQIVYRVFPSGVIHSRYPDAAEI